MNLAWNTHADHLWKPEYKKPTTYKGTEKGKDRLHLIPREDCIWLGFCTYGQPFSLLPISHEDNLLYLLLYYCCAVSV